LRRWFSAAERGIQLAPEVFVVGTTGSPCLETVGFGLGVVGIGVDVVVGKVAGVAEGAISVVVGIGVDVVVGKVVGVAAGAISVVVGIGVDVVVGKVVGVAAGANSVAAGGFVSSRLGGSFVGVSSTVALTATLASGVGVSAI